MPLAAGIPNQAALPSLEALTIADLAPGPSRDEAMARGCLAGLWLRHGFLDRAHILSQRIETAEGSYWHGLMHRREGDYANAKYWFARVGTHAIHPPLAAAARRESGAGTVLARLLGPNGQWDAAGFVDLCAEAVAGASPHLTLALALQAHEWSLLFDHCLEAAGAPPT
ncbi:MAG: hypothetical protein FJX56_00820 [Alphaproteobacteria bacterium]|nr:hypothetical protein [Alphaproteobacteria bacterium]